MLNRSPPTKIEPDRLAPGLAAAVNAMVPLPLPLAPEVTVIHESGVTAVHAQPLDVARVNGPAPPAAGTVAPLELSVYADTVRFLEHRR